MRKKTVFALALSLPSAVALTDTDGRMPEPSPGTGRGGYAHPPGNPSRHVFGATQERTGVGCDDKNTEAATPGRKRPPDIREIGRWSP